MSAPSTRGTSGPSPVSPAAAASSLRSQRRSDRICLSGRGDPQNHRGTVFPFGPRGGVVTAPAHLGRRTDPGRFAEHPAAHRPDLLWSHRLLVSITGPLNEAEMHRTMMENPGERRGSAPLQCRRKVKDLRSADTAGQDRGMNRLSEAVTWAGG